MSRAGRKIDVSTSPGSERRARTGARATLLALALGARATLLALALGALAPQLACVSSGEGDKMQAEISDLRTRLDDIDKRDKEYKEQVVRLKKVLDEATALLTRNSADVGAKAAKSEQDIAAVQGRVEEMSHAQELQARQLADENNRLETRLAALEQTQTKIVDRVAPVMPDDKDQLWSQAGQRLASGQRDEGRRFYRVFIQRFPADPRAPQAYLAIGMSFVQETKQPNAAAEFQKILDTYPKSPEVPEAMWQLSRSFVELHFCTDARSLLSDLVKRYPKTSRAIDAKAEIKTISKLPKSACSS
ncbi:MAG TPA: tetratricopeptide repeat protein [Polyangia bacterium]|nr:tetratricopeptide repeat protein [Polyangia bacterium]